MAKTKKFKSIMGSGTKSEGGRIIYESICNFTGCYNDAKSRYGYCASHKDGREVTKNGEWMYDN